MPVFDDNVASQIRVLLPSVLLLIAGAGVTLNPASAQHPTAVTSIVNSNQDTTLEANYNGSLLMSGEFINLNTPNDSIPTEGAGTRMMWYPAKAAFRAGRVWDISAGGGADGDKFWNASNVGIYSVALGENTKASEQNSVAMGENATASGGAAVAMGQGTIASGIQATAMGRETNAGGNRSTALGNGSIASGDEATAIGVDAKATDPNSFVFSGGISVHDFNGDGTDDGLSSAKTVGSSDPTGFATFTVGVRGGVRFVTGSNEVTYLTDGSTGWSSTSTRSAKTNVSSVDPSAILAAVNAMPVTTWEYKDENGNGQGTRHIGPMAEDFHGELPYDIGSGDAQINSINADGVALGAIKGLAQKVEQQQVIIDSLRNRVQHVEDLQTRMAQLEARSGGPVWAGLTGSGLWVGLLLGGLFGAGLFWRRRT
jgi:hypothetical protein